MKKEFILWGIEPSKQAEEILYTKASTMEQAQTAKYMLETRYQCRAVRIQTIDFYTAPNFVQALNI
jgi:hypothetical protein